MGEVVILHPKSCLKKHPTTMKSHRTIRFAHDSTNPSTQIPSFTKPDPRKQIPLKNHPINTQNKNLVMGQVKLLKRGEALHEASKVLKDVNCVKKVEASNRPESFQVKAGRRTKVLAENKKMLSKSGEDVVVCSTNRIGPDPKIVTKQMKNKMAECFSGSVFSDSPHPSSVPLPGFFMKNRSKTMNNS